MLVAPEMKVHWTSVQKKKGAAICKTCVQTIRQMFVWCAITLNIKPQVRIFFLFFFFHNNGEISLELIGLFLSSVRRPSHKTLVYAADGVILA